MSFAIQYSRSTPENLYQEYWAALMTTDRFALRFCKSEDPDFSEVSHVHHDDTMAMFYVVSNDVIISEFTLENFTGKAAQIHFSMHPALPFKDALKVGRSVTDIVITEWKNPDDSQYIKTLYGITPVTNKAALIFNLRVGFKKMGILPDGMEDRGRIVDGVVVYKTEREVKDGRRRR